MTNLVESFNVTSSVFAARLDGFYPSRIEWWARVSILPLPQAFMDGMHGRQSSLSCETRVLDTLLCAQSLLALHVGSCPYGSPSHTVTCHLTADENEYFSLDSKLLRYFLRTPTSHAWYSISLGPFGAQRYALFRRRRHQNGTRVPHKVFARGKAKHYLEAIAITRNRVLADD